MNNLRRVLIGLSIPVAACTADWPSLGYDTGMTYNNKTETMLTTSNASLLKARWTTPLYGRVNGAPAVVADVVYFQSTTGTYAVRALNGQQIWRNATAAGTSSVAVSNGVVFVNDSGATLRALRATDGVQIWQADVDPHPNAAGFSSPTVYDRYVFIGSSSNEEFSNSTDTTTFRGSVVAYDRNTGQQIWRRYTVDPPFNGASIWSTIAVDPALGYVFGATGNNYLGTASNTSDSIFAVRITDGSVVWWTQVSGGDVFTVFRPLSPDADFGASPILFDGSGGRKLVGAGQKSGSFWALDRQTGAIVWTRSLSGGNALTGGMLNNGAYDGQRILVASNTGTSTGPGSEPANGESPPLVTPTTSRLAALNPANGNILWERQLPAWVWAPITVANGVAFVAYETQVQAFNASNGQKLFTYKTNGTISSAPVVSNGAVFFGSGMAYIVGHVDQTVHALAL